MDLLSRSIQMSITGFIMAKRFFAQHGGGYFAIPKLANQNLRLILHSAIDWEELEQTGCRKSRWKKERKEPFDMWK